MANLGAPFRGRHLRLRSPLRFEKRFCRSYVFTFGTCWQPRIEAPERHRPTHKVRQTVKKVMQCEQTVRSQLMEGIHK